MDSTVGADSDVGTTSAINPLGHTEAGDDDHGDQTLAGSLGSDSEPAAERRPSMTAGQSIGRYVYLEMIGTGGMGMVIAAYDPELDRRVAIKLVQERSPTSEHRQRMRREAMAMAKLSHPNVVTVYEVGEHEGQLFVAMEYVKGLDLARWLRQRNNQADWRAVLEVFVQAGHGLAAAHRAGLVHRDFKPANVFVGDDGRVRVGDFGLARRPLDDDPETVEMRKKARVSTDSLGPTLTVHGAIVGTPAYMAPEQFGAKPTDARTDQFSFCVALWEALFGQRPFPGRSIAEILHNVTQGVRAPVPSDHAVPGWIRRALDRGLSIDPNQRYPNLDDLLTALQADPTRRRRAWLAVGIVVIVSAGWFAVHNYAQARQVAACEAEGASIDDVWNDSVRSQLHDGLLATKAANAESSAARVLPYVDKQAQAWKLARTQACLDTRVHETWDEDMLQRAVWCLDERKLQFEALLAEFTRADQEVLQTAISAAAGLPPVDSCLDTHRLAMLPALPDDPEQTRVVQRELARALALEFTANYDASLEASKLALAEAERLAWVPLTAAARVQLGSSLSSAGEYEEAEDTLERAYFEAAEAGALEVATLASNLLTYVVGYELARHDEGVLWSRHTDVLLANLGISDHDRMRALADNALALVYESMGDYQQAKRLNERSLEIDEALLGSEHMDVATDVDNLARVHHALGDYERAKALHERGLFITEKALGPDHPQVAGSLNQLALVYDSMGDRAEAKRLLQRALAIREATLGPEHPDVALTLNNLASLLRAMGDHDQARKLHERALAIRLAALGPDHPEVATSLNNLANLLLSVGEHDEAKSRFEQALALYERTLGPEHSNVASALNGLGLVHKALEQYDQARGFHARALAIRERALGPDHPAVGTDLINLAGVHLLLGEHDRAKPLFERALAIYEKASPEHPHVGYALNGLAKVALAQQRPADAVPLAERAVHILVAADEPPRRLAQGRFTLARALWDAPEDGGRDRDRALTLAQQARDDFRAAPNSEDELAQVETFLAERTSTK